MKNEKLKNNIQNEKQKMKIKIRVLKTWRLGIVGRLQ